MVNREEFDRALKTGEIGPTKRKPMWLSSISEDSITTVGRREVVSHRWDTRSHPYSPRERAAHASSMDAAVISGLRDMQIVSMIAGLTQTQSGGEQ